MTAYSGADLTVHILSISSDIGYYIRRLSPLRNRLMMKKEFWCQKYFDNFTTQEIDKEA
jgi:hypothetical protein